MDAARKVRDRKAKLDLAVTHLSTTYHNATAASKTLGSRNHQNGGGETERSENSSTAVAFMVNTSSNGDRQLRSSCLLKNTSKLTAQQTLSTFRDTVEEVRHKHLKQDKLIVKSFNQNKTFKQN